MKILVVGSGGREHALLWALSKSARRQLKLYCAPGNAGIADIAECVEIDATDITSLAQFAEEQQLDLTVVGSEAPLAAGIVDEFERRNLAIAGARRDAARLESSKAFAKDFMARNRVPTARYKIADSATEAQRILSDFWTGAWHRTIQADGG